MFTLIVINAIGFAVADLIKLGSRKVQQDKDIKDINLSMYAEVMKLNTPTSQAMRDIARNSSNTTQGIIDAIDKIESKF